MEKKQHLSLDFHLRVDARHRNCHPCWIVPCIPSWGIQRLQHSFDELNPRGQESGNGLGESEGTSLKEKKTVSSTRQLHVLGSYLVESVK
jgi:hypothetical protein